MAATPARAGRLLTPVEVRGSPRGGPHALDGLAQNGFSRGRPGWVAFVVTEANDVELRLARLKPNVSSVLAADGLIDRIGPGNIHGNVHRAVDAAQAAFARRFQNVTDPPAP